jgi:AmmeMemoRadiSam system protein A
LFVISTDFSHYPPYQDAKVVDKRTAEAIVSKDPDLFLHTIEENKTLGIPNLATSICGWSSVLTLMYLAKDDPDLEFKIIDYRNSGDAVYGDHSQVVGYYAIALVRKANQQTQEDTAKEQNFALSTKDKRDLLNIARTTLEQYIRNGIIPKFDTTQFSEALKTKAGAFVTLKIGDKLRGCIGRFQPNDPLWSVVQQMAIAAATEDPRFTPVQPDELDKILIEISVLTPLRRVHSPDDVVIGKNGVYCRYGFQSGTLLPQVAVEQGWDAEQFVRYCCRYKAGLDERCWEYAELYVYDAIVFDEAEFK